MEKKRNDEMRNQTFSNDKLILLNLYLYTFFYRQEMSKFIVINYSEKK